MPLRTRFNPMPALLAMFAFTACADNAPVSPFVEPVPNATANVTPHEHENTVNELRRITARYHDVERALADGFVPVLTTCEASESLVIPYANIARLLDGVLDPSLPDALLYEALGSKRKLVGVEMVMPYPLWTQAEPPRFLGVPLQREDELGVFGLHIWIWRHNPNGVFAQINPNISCDL